MMALSEREYKEAIAELKMYKEKRIETKWGLEPYIDNAIEHFEELLGKKLEELENLEGMERYGTH